ncbi:hypothetical protein D7Y09_11540 [bacterium 1XD42-1]|nr:hypothetical protein D7X25_10460 [bacterium 1XD42-8]RKJ63358.1 hypothetical protein D7Y09_11540 [bacterium 1XD42-1]
MPSKSHRFHGGFYHLKASRKTFQIGLKTGSHYFETNYIVLCRTCQGTHESWWRGGKERCI